MPKSDNAFISLLQRAAAGQDGAFHTLRHQLARRLKPAFNRLGSVTLDIQFSELLSITARRVVNEQSNCPRGRGAQARWIQDIVDSVAKILKEKEKRQESADAIVEKCLNLLRSEESSLLVAVASGESVSVGGSNSVDAETYRRALARLADCFEVHGES